MALRSNDPVYYKIMVSELIKQALNEGLEVNVEVSEPSNSVAIMFRAENGDKAGIRLSV